MKRQKKSIKTLKKTKQITHENENIKTVKKSYYNTKKIDPTRPTVID